MSEINSLVRVGLYLDTSHPKRSGLCNVKIRLHYKGRNHYVKTDLDLEPIVFKSVYKSRRIAPKYKPIEARL